MNKIIFCISMIFCFVAMSAAQFEGEISMKLTENSEGTSHETLLNMSVKNDMMTSSFAGTDKEEKTGRVIFRGDKKVMWVVSDDDKTYIEMLLNERKGSKTCKYHEKKKTKPNMRKTGNAQTILGYPCEEWILENEDEGEVSNVWATTKLGNIYEGIAKSFKGIGGMESKESMGQWGELADMKIFPLKVTTSREGTVTEIQEVTKIESKTLATSTFEPPADYKKQSIDLDLKKMMEGMKGRDQGNQGEPGQNVDVEKMMKEMQEKMKDVDTKGDSLDKKQYH